MGDDGMLKMQTAVPGSVHAQAGSSQKGNVVQQM